MIFNFNKKIFFITAITLIATQFLFIPSSARAAATLTLSSGSQQVYNGSTFVVDLKISSTDTSMNTIDGTVVFDKNALQVQSINTATSIFTLWPVAPLFHNNTGQITFVGGIPGGFLGQNGEVFRIYFIAKKSGTTKIDFLDTSSVFLNDGLGTRVNPWLEPTSISVIKKPINRFLVIAGIVILLFISTVLIIIAIRLRKKQKIN